MELPHRDAHIQIIISPVPTLMQNANQEWINMDNIARLLYSNN